MLCADGFWNQDLVDSLSVVGFPLAVVSIWMSWWLAKRDVKERIDHAQRQTVERLTRALLQPDVSETARWLKEAREACRAKRWERAIDRCEQAQHRIPTFIALSGLDESDRGRLQLAVDQLRLLVVQLEEVAAKKRTEVTARKLNELADLIAALGTIEGKLRASGLR